MNFGLILTFAALLLMLHLLTARFLAPFGLFLSPVFLYQATRLFVNAGKRGLSLWLCILATAAFVCLQDAGLKLYAGGDHDLPGLGWIQVIMGFGAFAAFTQLLDLVILKKQPSIFSRSAALVVYVLMIALYEYYFWDLGLKHE